jgi:hypothetical protein
MRDRPQGRLVGGNACGTNAWECRPPWPATASTCLHLRIHLAPFQRARLADDAFSVDCAELTTIEEWETQRLEE